MSGLHNRYFRRLIFAPLIAFLLTISIVSHVGAHATLLRSDPVDGATLDKAPTQINLWFDEAISPKFSSMQLFDADSQLIPVRSIQTDPTDSSALIVALPELSDGVYTILWKVLSETDGHFSQGLVVFGIGAEANPTATTAVPEADVPPLPEVVLRWLNFSLLAGLIGALAVSRYILIIDARTAATGLVLFRAKRRALKQILDFALLWALLGFLINCGLLVWQTRNLAATFPTGLPMTEVAEQILSQTRWGQIWLARQTSQLLIMAALAWLQISSQREGFLHLPAWRLSALLVILLTLLQALTGHAAALRDNASLAVIVDMIHLLAAGVWVGGLLTLGLSFGLLLHSDLGSAIILARATWKPFGQVAVISFGLLVITGLYSTGRQVASLDALLTTTYGQMLLTKLSVIIGVSFIGFINASLLHPRLVRPLARLLRLPGGRFPFSIRDLPRLILFESILGLGVFLMTGLITASPAPRGPAFTIDPETVPTALSQTMDDLVVTLSAKPNRPGQNVFTVFTASSRRPAPAEIMRVILRFTYRDQQLGRVSATAEEIESGRFHLTGNYLSQAGQWQIDVVVRRRGKPDSIATFDWTVAPVGQARSVFVSKAPLEYPLTLIAVGLIICLLFVLITVRFRAGRFPVVRTSGTKVVRMIAGLSEIGHMSGKEKFSVPKNTTVDQAQVDNNPVRGGSP